MIGELPSKGLKFWVMLVSGEDSMTSAGSLELEGAVEALVEVVAEALVEVAGGVVVEELDEQAAKPAARRPVAVIATALLLVILLIVNLTFPSEGNAIERESCFPLIE